MHIQTLVDFLRFLIEMNESASPRPFAFQLEPHPSSSNASSPCPSSSSSSASSSAGPPSEPGDLFFAGDSSCRHLDLATELATILSTQIPILSSLTPFSIPADRAVRLLGSSLGSLTGDIRLKPDRSRQIGFDEWGDRHRERKLQGAVLRAEVARVFTIRQRGC